MYVDVNMRVAQNCSVLIVRWQSLSVCAAYTNWN